MFALVVVVAISRTGRAGAPAAPQSARSPFRGASMPPGIRTPAFRLTDEYGRRVSMAQYRGKPLVVTFLYTRCKQICPLQAQMIRGALDDLEQDVPALALSLDPARDTRARARAFNRRAKLTGRLRWVLGTRRELQRLWRGFAIRPYLGDNGHQAYITLVDGRGLQRVAVLATQTSPEDLAHDIRVLEKS